MKHCLSLSQLCTNFCWCITWNLKTLWDLWLWGEKEKRPEAINTCARWHKRWYRFFLVSFQKQNLLSFWVAVGSLKMRFTSSSFSIMTICSCCKTHRTLLFACVVGCVWVWSCELIPLSPRASLFSLQQQCTTSRSMVWDLSNACSLITY